MVYSDLDIFDVLDITVDEEYLNKLIQEPKDIFSLETALKLKAYYISKERQEKIPFSFKTIIHLIRFTHENHFKMLQNALMIQSQDDEFTDLIGILKEKLASDEEFLFYLTVYECLLNFLEIVNNHIIKNILQQNVANIVHCILKKETLNKYQTVKILMKSLKNMQNESKTILNVIWEYVLKTKKLELLCALSEFYFIKSNSFSLINENNFWIMLEEMLYNQNNTLQKQTLFLLNKAIKNVLNSDEFSSSFITFKTNNKKEISEAWKCFFILLEVSKEKQLHLIQPAFPLLNRISILSPLSLAYIYNVYLSHIQNTVSYYALITFFKNPQSYNSELFQRVIHNALLALNKNECSDYSLEAFHIFGNFVNKMIKDLQKSLLFKAFSVTWAPVPYYFFCKNILTSSIKLEILEILQFVNQIDNLPHKFIRRECAHMLNVYVLKNFDFGTSPEKEIKLFEALYFFDNTEDLKQNFFEKCREYFENTFLELQGNYSYSLYSVDIILGIIKNCNIETEWITNILKNPLKQNKFPLDVTLHILLHFPYFLDVSFLASYLQMTCDGKINRENIKCFVKVIAKMYEENLNADISHLLSKYSDTVLNMAKKDDNTAFAAFEIFKRDNSYIKYLTQVEVILNYWTKNINNSNQIDPDFCTNFLHVYNKYKIETSDYINHEMCTEICNLYERLCDILAHSNYPLLFSCMKPLIEKSETKNFPQIFNLIDTFKKHLKGVKRTDTFSLALDSFLKSILLNKKLSVAHEYRNKCLEILSDLMTHSKRLIEIPLLISKTLLTLSEENLKLLTLFVSTIIDLLLYGDILRKDQLAEFMVCYSIFKERKCCLENVFAYQRNLIQINTVNIIQNLMASDDETKKNVADQITSALIDIYVVVFNKRYYKDSQVHLNKLKILQALLVVHPHISLEIEQQFVDTLINCLCTESNQVSVRFFLQWLLIQLLSRDTNCIEKIIEKVNSANKTQPSTITSFLLILYHLAQKFSDMQEYIKIMENILPWTMGAQFNLRFYAQIIFIQMYEKAEEKHFSNIVEKFAATYKAVRQVVETTNRKLDAAETFFVETFLPDEHYTLENIYVTFPKLANVTVTEYLLISATDFKSNRSLPSSNNHKICINFMQDVINNNNFNVFENREISSMIIQKKIIPWKDDFEETLQRKIGDLVVVASLIEKAPNLGGLSRTCEVFGVKKLVIGNSAVTNMHEFQSLSMSSESWVDIMEIRAENLGNYLTKEKNEGSLIVGAEQTSESVKLTDFQFPRRCVLVLGNEKQGIPPNLLYLLDACIEIPQIGVIRSLNVHVAASIIIWEYAKQHLL